MITKSFNDKNKLYCAFIDLRKAFNSVYREGLWFKLVNSGVGGRLFKIIRDLYSKVRCRVRARGGKLTDIVLKLLGLQQGATLSPYLFAFYLNNLVDWLNPHGGVLVGGVNIKVLLFADDMVFVSNSRDGLQCSLNILYDFFRDWKLTVNLQKSNILVCRPRNIQDPMDVWYYGDDILLLCGITFTHKGICHTGFDVLANQAKKSLECMQANLWKIGTYPPAVTLRLFHVCISPILCYGAEVWGYAAVTKHQTILNRWCKRILVLLKSPRLMQQWVASWVNILSSCPVKFRSWSIGPRLWRDQEIDTDTSCTSISKTCPWTTNRNWSHEVKLILHSVGKEVVWYDEDIQGPCPFISDVKCILIDTYR